LYLAISTDLIATLGPIAMSDRLLMRFLREAKYPQSNPPITFSQESPRFDDSDESYHACTR
jgi:hypothetical protein